MFSHYWKTQFLYKEKEKEKKANLLKDVLGLNLKNQLSEISDLNEKYNTFHEK